MNQKSCKMMDECPHDYEFMNGGTTTGVYPDRKIDQTTVLRGLDSNTMNQGSMPYTVRFLHVSKRPTFISGLHEAGLVITEDDTYFGKHALRPHRLI